MSHTINTPITFRYIVIDTFCMTDSSRAQVNLFSCRVPPKLLISPLHLKKKYTARIQMSKMCCGPMTSKAVKKKNSSRSDQTVAAWIDFVALTSKLRWHIQNAPSCLRELPELNLKEVYQDVPVDHPQI